MESRTPHVAASDTLRPADEIITPRLRLRRPTPDDLGAVHGYASEALAAIVRHVFAAGDVPALKADVDPRNTASLNLLCRLGFREVGRSERTCQVGDERCDSVYLELERTQ